jgi:hypothetical protein
MSSVYLCEERIKLTGTIESVKIVATADVYIADPDLRHGRAPAATPDNLGSEISSTREIDLLICHTFAAQQLLGHVAVAAVPRSVDLDPLHERNVPSFAANQR